MSRRILIQHQLFSEVPGKGNLKCVNQCHEVYLASQFGQNRRSCRDQIGDLSYGKSADIQVHEGGGVVTFKKVYPFSRDTHAVEVVFPVVRDAVHNPLVSQKEGFGESRLCRLLVHFLEVLVKWSESENFVQAPQMRLPARPTDIAGEPEQRKRLEKSGMAVEEP